MALKFYNVRNKEVRVAETEPMVSALWASSDRGPNARQGQDFGWRLAPEVVVELRRIAADIAKIEHIALTYRIDLSEVGEKEILQYISDKTAVEDAPVAQEGDYTDEYEREIRRLEKNGEDEVLTTETTTVAARRGRPSTNEAK